MDVCADFFRPLFVTSDHTIWHLIENCVFACQTANSFYLKILLIVSVSVWFLASSIILVDEIVSVDAFFVLGVVLDEVLSELTSGLNVTRPRLSVEVFAGLPLIFQI